MGPYPAVKFMKAGCSSQRADNHPASKFQLLGNAKSLEVPKQGLTYLVTGENDKEFLIQHMFVETHQAQNGFFVTTDWIVLEKMESNCQRL